MNVLPYSFAVAGLVSWQPLGLSYWYRPEAIGEIFFARPPSLVPLPELLSKVPSSSSVAGSVRSHLPD